MKQDREQRGDDALVFRVAQLFLGERGAGCSPSDIADQVSGEFKRQPPLTREAIYPLIGEAVRRGFLRLVPPVDRQLTEQVSASTPYSSQAPCRWSRPRGRTTMPKWQS